MKGWRPGDVARLQTEVQGLRDRNKQLREELELYKKYASENAYEVDIKLVSRCLKIAPSQAAILLLLHKVHKKSTLTAPEIATRLNMPSVQTVRVQIWRIRTKHAGLLLNKPFTGYWLTDAGFEMLEEILK